MNGILSILKPPGMTSHDVVSRVRRLVEIRRVGHTGTLDPGAAGVLPVCVGKATRVSEYVLGMNKSYRAELRLGTATDTLDASGQATASKEIPVWDEDEVRRILSRFRGPGSQVPPMYSAVRKNGVRLYELARRGETTERSPRSIHIYQLDVIRYTGKVILFDVTCSRGTYIRTLCSDIADKLGTCGHMSFLLRTAVGPFTLDQTYTLEELTELKSRNELHTALWPLDTALARFPALSVTAEQALKIQNGVAVQHEAPPVDGPVRLYDPYGRFLAVANSVKGLLKPEKVFH